MRKIKYLLLMLLALPIFALTSCKQMVNERITDLTAYIQENYGSDFKVTKDASLSSSLKSQLDLSAYIKKVDGNKKITEPNCAIVSVYNALQTIQIHNDNTGFPSANDVEVYNVFKEEPKLLSTLDSFELKSETIVFPKLYITVRQMALKKFDKAFALSFSESIELAEAVAKEYDYNLNYEYNMKINDTDTFKKVVSMIENKKAGILSINAGGFYGSHQLCIIGYATVSNGSKTYNFYKVLDGYNGIAYFDLKDYAETKAIGTTVYFS